MAILKRPWAAAPAMAIVLAASPGAWAQTSGAQSSTPSTQSGTSTSASTSSQYPPAQVVQFYIAHPGMFQTMDSTTADGRREVTGSQTDLTAVRNAMDKSTLLNATSKAWILQNELSNSPNAYDTNNEYIAFKARLALVNGYATTKRVLEDQLEVAKRLDASNEYITKLQNDIQGLQDQLAVSRAQMLDYATDAIKAQRAAKASGGSSPDASGSGSSATDDQQTTIVPVSTITAEMAASIDSAIADVATAGDAIARAYVDPTGILNQANRGVTKAEADAMIARIGLSLAATSATPIEAQAPTGNFASDTASSPITVATLNPIYKNYKVTVGTNGALVVSVPTLQVRTPTGVMTIPSNQVTVPSTQLAVTSTQINVTSTQVNVPSTRVNVPSTQVNVPSTQVNVPSTQVQTPSSVMTSLDLQPALCGR